MHRFTDNIVCMLAAEDWLKPDVVLQAFEARAARMSVACAQKLAEFSNPEEGILHLPCTTFHHALSCLLRWAISFTISILVEEKGSVASLLIPSLFYHLLCKYSDFLL